jgi:ERCC4-type nuclease
MANGEWIVEKSAAGGRFPYRVTLVGPHGVVIRVMAAGVWPGAGKNIFCLRAQATSEGFEEIERVPVIEWRQNGGRLTFSLDRAMNKRAEFLVLIKGRKEGQGNYEQIFFRTQAAIEAHRSKGRVDLYGSVQLKIAVDARERYGWTFGPEAEIVRRSLHAGDYALLIDERIAAAVERKSFQNLLSDLYSIKTLHQKMGELAAYRHAAVVVEGQYADLSDPRKIERCSPAHLLRVVAELAVLHPKVPLIWAGNRKLAAVWTAQFFIAAAREAQGLTPEALNGTPDLFAQEDFDGGVDQRIRQTVLEIGPAGFKIAQLMERLEGVPQTRVTRIVKSMREEGAIQTQGHGRGTVWATPPLVSAAN